MVRSVTNINFTNVATPPNLWENHPITQPRGGDKKQRNKKQKGRLRTLNTNIQEISEHILSREASPDPL